MLETLIASVFTVNISLLVIIIHRIAKPYQPYMNQTQEEDLPDYQEHDKGWEFKILRTRNDGFRRGKLLRLVCAEESESGWILLEKLDDNRLRFRRLVKFRETDHLAKQDPYRTYYGVAPRITNFISIGIILLIMSIPAFLGFSFMQNIFKSVRTQNLQPLKTTPKPQTPVSLPKPLAKPNPPNPSPAGL
jgi:hypothetical protein